MNPAKAGGIHIKKEYSIFGNPEVKIGDFIQSKLGDFNG